MGRQGRAEIRRQGMKLQDAVFWLYPYVEATELQDRDEGPFRIACCKYGAYVATAARGIVRSVKMQHEIRLREEGGANEPSDGAASSEGVPVAKARPSLAVRPDPPPPPRRPD
eukprot:3363348-Pyramimonas_sp.AAC.1